MTHVYSTDWNAPSYIFTDQAASTDIAAGIANRTPLYYVPSEGGFFYRPVGSAPVRVVTPSAFASQSANTILAGPTTGAAAAPTFRALVDADLVVAPVLIPTAAGRNLVNGTGQAGVIPLRLRHTTEQLRLEYDATHYASFTISSTGDLTLASSASGTVTTFSSTGAVTLPVGTTGQQPTPAAGMVRYNSTTSRFEFYSSAWKNHTRLDGDTMTGTLEIDVATATSNALILKSTDDSGTNPVFKVLNSTGGTIQSQITADGRLALYGTAFTDANTIIQSLSAISIVGSATQWTLHRFTPTVTITTANETSSIISVNGSLTLNQNGFNVTTANATTYQLTLSGTTGNLTNGRAMNMAITNSGGGTIAVATTLFISAPTNSGGGGITSYAGASINAASAATNNTLLLLGTSTIASGNWSIYSSTTNDSALAGKTKLGATSSPAATLDAATTDAVTAAVTNVALISHNSSGTPAANYGTGVSVLGKSSTTSDTSMIDIQAIWTTATHASRKARGTLIAYDTAARTCFQWEASGSAAMLGFYGTAPVVKSAAYTQTYSTAARTVNPASTSTFTGIDNAQAGTPYAKVTDLEQLRGDVLMAFQIENSIIDDFQANGMFQ